MTKETLNISKVVSDEEMGIFECLYESIESNEINSHQTWLEMNKSGKVEGKPVLVRFNRQWSKYQSVQKFLEEEKYQAASNRTNCISNIANNNSALKAWSSVMKGSDFFQKGEVVKMRLPFALVLYNIVHYPFSKIAYEGAAKIPVKDCKVLTGAARPIPTIKRLISFLTKEEIREVQINLEEKGKKVDLMPYYYEPVKEELDEQLDAA